MTQNGDQKGDKGAEVYCQKKSKELGLKGGPL